MPLLLEPSQSQQPQAPMLPPLPPPPPIPHVHAFHVNLPPQYQHPPPPHSGTEADEEAPPPPASSIASEEEEEKSSSSSSCATNVPLLTQLVHRKAREVLARALAIQLMPCCLFYHENGDEDEAITEMEDHEDDEEDLEDEDEEEEQVITHPTNNSKNTLQTLTKQLTRVHGQLLSLDSLKCPSPFTAHELCALILHFLSLVTCTLEDPTARTTHTNTTSTESTESSSTSGSRYSPPQVTLHFEKVGYIWQGHDESWDHDNDSNSEKDRLVEALQRPFALPSPPRELLLLILLHLLRQYKSVLRGVSNASLYPQEDHRQDEDNNQTPPPPRPQPRILLLLNWKALLRCLIRTAPYLDPQWQKCSTSDESEFTARFHSIIMSSDAQYRQSTVLRRTVHLIRNMRRFFDQGIRPPPPPPGPNNTNTSTSTNTNHSVILLDHSARQVSQLVEADLAVPHAHTHACYRGTILLYLFHPSRCSAEYYAQHALPFWTRHVWTLMDRCPEFDFLIVSLLCRARKYIQRRYDSASHNSNPSSSFDWGPVRRKLLTLSQYWWQLPIGGTTSVDARLPRSNNHNNNSSSSTTALPRPRTCPHKLKVLTGMGSGSSSSSSHSSSSSSSSSGSGNSSSHGGISNYEEGLDFIAKVVKLLVHTLGTGSPVQPHNRHNDDTSSSLLSEGTRDVLRFVSFVTPYFHPSNLGSWTFPLGAFLHYFAYQLCCRVGAQAGHVALQQSHPHVSAALEQALPGMGRMTTTTTTTNNEGLLLPHEVVALLHALLPLCQQAIYSKHPHVGRAGEAALLYLVQIDPLGCAPSFLDSALRALDVQSVHTSHQAPSALSVLTRLIQPTLRSGNALVLLQRLPAILSLSLAGIDSNDQNKTIRTLILYRTLTSWLPVGGNSSSWKTLPIPDEASERSNDENCRTSKNNNRNPNADGTMRIGHNLWQSMDRFRECDAYQRAVARLPESSLLRAEASVSEPVDAHDLERFVSLLKDATAALSDWAMDFLERVFGLLRAAGEREKTAKTLSGVATRHSTADVLAGRNFSRVLGECLFQLFAAMEEDVYEMAVRYVVRFLQEETLPLAAKDASLLCLALGAARSTTFGSPGFNALVPVLTSDMQKQSVKTAIYRLRCLAGAVRFAGISVLAHRVILSQVVDFALDSDNRHLFKTGCKLLRHLLSTLSESFPIATDFRPCVYTDATGAIVLGRSAQLHNDPVQWNVPDVACIEFAGELLSRHVSERLTDLRSSALGDSPNRSKLLNGVECIELRQCLRVIRYSIRGGASLLLDQRLIQNSKDIVAHEMASYRLIEATESPIQESLIQLRGRICSFLLVLSSVIAADTLHPDGFETLDERDSFKKILPLLGSDPKVCKEVCEIALLLLTRRGAAFRSQEALTIWKAQKQGSADFSLCAQVDRMTEAFQAAGVYGNGATSLYKDGEDAGKTIPRRLLVTRVHIFHTSLQRNASFEVPRRLRREERSARQSRNVLFLTKPSLPENIAYLEDFLTAENCPPLDAYEGIIDGLFSLCCHSNTQVRASAIGVVDYAMTRFGWIVAPRVPRLLSELSLQDSLPNGKFGIPSCAALVNKLNHQGKRKRLAEAIKGVCSILSLARAVRQTLGSSKTRYQFVVTVCGTDHLISLLPAEEMQKIVHYLQAVFSPFRSNFYVKPCTSSVESGYQERTIGFLLGILSEENAVETSSVELESSEKKGAHWRKLLIACWFLLVFVHESDINVSSGKDASRIWRTCFHLLETSIGQPLQRVALGLFGKLICLLDDASNVSEAKAKIESESFCKILADSLVYDHKEDNSVGGGHDAQWSSGVESIIRDANRLMAPRILFPFQRSSQSLGAFKIAHAQLIERLLSILDTASANTAAKHLLASAKVLAAASPTEDQRNQQVTAAEMFAGVYGSILRSSRASSSSLHEVWSVLLLPFLEEAIAKVPFSLSGAYFDAIRYAIQFISPDSFFPLTAWLVGKIKSTLWRPDTAVDATINAATVGGEDDDVRSDQNGSSSSASSFAQYQNSETGFTAQSKWLYLFSAVLIEMDVTELGDTAAATTTTTTTPTSSFIQRVTMNVKDDDFIITDVVSATTKHLDVVTNNDASPGKASWALVIHTLLPRLMEAMGHPFDYCRDHISRCLFRICYKHRTTQSRQRMSHSINTTIQSDNNSIMDPHDPGRLIVAQFSALLFMDDPNESATSTSYKEEDTRLNSMITARRFISHCIQLGEARHEFSEYVIPLLPLAFGVLAAANSAAANTNSTTSLRSEATPVPEAMITTMDEAASGTVPSNGEKSLTTAAATARRAALVSEVIQGYRTMIAEVSVTTVIAYDSHSVVDRDCTRTDVDIARVLDAVSDACHHATCWQVRHAGLHYLRCFQGAHKFLFSTAQTDRITALVIALLADDRREVSSAAMAALTGIVAAASDEYIVRMVHVHAKRAGVSKMRRNKKKKKEDDPAHLDKERQRAHNQQVSVFVLCAVIMARPYDTPAYVPIALQAIAPHSFERNAPLSIRGTVKRCCAEYKRTHLSDNWDEQRRMFSTEQLEAFEDVVSTPHYYA